MNGSSLSPVMLDPYAGMTVLSPVMAMLILVLSIAVLRAPRKYAIVPFIIAMNCIPFGVRIYVLGMNFTAMRILIVVALVRILLRREGAQLKVTALDGIVALYTVAAVATHVLLIGTIQSFMGAIGATLNTFWTYVVVRLLVRDVDDVRIMVRTFAILSLLLCVIFLYNSRTGINSFSMFGGVPHTLVARGSRFRVQGPYGHSILAGALWASIIPLVIAFRFRNRKRSLLMYVSMFCIVPIVWLTASSTPVMSLAVALVGTILYYQRNAVSKMTITAVAGIVALSIFYWHPVWFLIAKFNITGHSTGYFRAVMINEFVRHWRNWFLIGTTNTYAWGNGLGLGGVGLEDQTNQFVLEGAHGGIVALASFVGAIVVALRYVGRLVPSARNNQERWAFWCIGVSVVVHVTNFMGVDYFDQVTFSWWMMLAICSSLYCSRFLAFRGNRPFPNSGAGPRAVEGLN